LVYFLKPLLEITVMFVIHIYNWSKCIFKEHYTASWLVSICFKVFVLPPCQPLLIAAIHFAYRWLVLDFEETYLLNQSKILKISFTFTYVFSKNLLTYIDLNFWPLFFFSEEPYKKLSKQLY
jgi:hypothetical protein